MAPLRYGKYRIALDQGMDMGFPVGRDGLSLAFSLPAARFETVQVGPFVGEVVRGGSCNVETLHLTPHGNGTHTECYGHVSRRRLFITDLATEWMFPAVAAAVEKAPGEAITLDDLSEDARALLEAELTRGLILHVHNLPRLPFDFSGYDAPYLSASLAEWLSERVQHLLTNLPSLDRASSKTLPAHHAFLGKDPLHHTATELLRIPAHLGEGLYWTVLMVPAIATDAVPSRPLIYPMEAGDA